MSKVAVNNMTIREGTTVMNVSAKLERVSTRAEPLPDPFSGRIERLLEGFEPSFEFTAPPPLPEAEFAERVRRIRREAVLAGHDALVVHTDMVGWFHTSNAYLRYVCDWMREGVLLIPTDSDKEIVLLSFFTQSVILPPAGE